MQLGSGCHKVNAPSTEIQSVLEPFISNHQWHALCTNLGVDANQLSEMQLSYVDNSIKLETCLATFATQEGACWETVMLAVCDASFYNPDIANKIADLYDVSWDLLKDICGSKVK